MKRTTAQPRFHPGAARRGFAAILSISLIIFVGSALVVLGRSFAMDAERTRAQASEAQMRQLLTAGAVAAIQRAENAAPAAAVELPAELAAQQAAVAVQITGEGDDRTALVSAQFGQRHMEQTLKLRRAGPRWTVVAVD
jgi:hypothetical protein